LKGGEGMVELHWPAPAMNLETRPIVVHLHGLFFGIGFLSVAILAARPPLSWQTPLSSTLLVGGQALLVLGQVGTQYLVKHKRETLEVRIPSTGLGTHWMMIDSTKFTRSLARRRYTFPASSRDHIVLRQHHRLKGNFVESWKALLTMFILATGFLAFYVGGKSSHIRTVLIYIGLFVYANILKGPVVRSANQPIFTLLNNLGHETDVSEKARLEQEIQAVRDRSGPNSTWWVLPATLWLWCGNACRCSAISGRDNSFTNLQATEASASSQPDQVPCAHPEGQVDQLQCAAVSVRESEEKRGQDARGT
jgi:hypothetical protein